MQEVSVPTKRRRWPRRLLIGLVIFLLIFSAVSVYMVGQVFAENFGRAEPAKYSAFLSYGDVAESYPRREVAFMSGDNRLQGYVYGEPSDSALVVISHGLGGGADSYLAEITCFVDAGYRVFSFDNTGSHASEGEGTTGLAQSVLDLNAALGYISGDAELAALPVLLYGHSWGGYAVTAVLNYDHPAVAGSVSVAGYNSPMGLLYEQARDMIGWFAAIEYPYLWACQRAVSGSAAGLTAVDGINKSGIPVLIIHGSADDVVLMDGSGAGLFRGQS